MQTGVLHTRRNQRNDDTNLSFSRKGRWRDTRSEPKQRRTSRFEVEKSLCATALGVRACWFWKVTRSTVTPTPSKCTRRRGNRCNLKRGWQGKRASKRGNNGRLGEQAADNFQERQPTHQPPGANLQKGRISVSEKEDNATHTGRKESVSTTIRSVHPAEEAGATPRTPPVCRPKKKKEKEKRKPEVGTMRAARFKASNKARGRCSVLVGVKSACLVQGARAFGHT